MLSSSKLISWGTGEGLPVILLGIGLLVVLKSHDQSHHEAFKIIAIALLGLLVVGLAVSGQAVAVGQYLLSLVGL